MPIPFGPDENLEPSEPTPAEALIEAKQRAVHAWYRFAHDRNLQARVPDWRTSTAPDGTPKLSVEVVGPGAAHVLHLFASCYPLILGQPGDLQPTFTYDTPGRTSCVWRTGGVWVELWHPDTATGPHTPDGPVPAPQAPRTTRRPSGRLPFVRRTKTPKETLT